MALWEEVTEETFIKGLFSRLLAELRGTNKGMGRPHFAKNTVILYHLGSEGQREGSIEARDWTIPLLAVGRSFQEGSVVSRRETALVNQRASRKGARGTTSPWSPPSLSIWLSLLRAKPNGEPHHSRNRSWQRWKEDLEGQVYPFCPSKFHLLLCLDLLRPMHRLHSVKECCRAWLLA